MRVRRDFNVNVYARFNDFQIKTQFCYSLVMGVPTVETIIHKNILNLFVNSTRSQGSVEYDIIKRQLVMRSSDENSGCNEVTRILNVYGLPSAYEPFLNPQSKDTCKSMLNSKINCYLETCWEQENLGKESLKYMYLNPKSVVVGTPRVWWSSVRYNIRDNRRSELKVKILTGAYI